ncbi:MAG: hypothetical protein CSA97_03355, partial [Bacteroidetes bacterium]
MAFMLLVNLAFAGSVVRFGSHRVTPPPNVQQRTRGSEMKVQKDNPYVLLQFSTTPSGAQHRALRQLGVELQDYVGGNAYFAKVPAGFSPSRLAPAGAISMMAIAPEWKVNPLVMAGQVPSWAEGAGGRLKLIARYWPGTDRAQLARELKALGASSLRFSSEFQKVELELAQSVAMQLAELPSVKMVTLTSPPMELRNLPGMTLSHDNVLAQPGDLGGRGLTGEGVKVGIWDGNVQHHPDMDSRVHVQEYELMSDHGMHVAGTVAGSGLMDPLARGMAPKTDVYTYNFNVQSNGKESTEEMAEAYHRFGINLTQNSYGYNLAALCGFYHELSYNTLTKESELDELSYKYPKLLHVFAAGNEQSACAEETREMYGESRYGTATNRSKNALTVGAVWPDGRITSFSSWGPLDDGRLLPIVSGVGRNVYSTIYGNSYGEMSGTSMACPTVSGSLALVTQRYQQLNGFQIPEADLLRALAANTADEAGTVGPDYKYGYGYMNAENAVVALENGWYDRGEFAPGASDAQKFEIQVPAGMNAKQLRVMVAWMDATNDKNYAYGEPALINDLDLLVKEGGKTYRPLVLDPKHPMNEAKEGVDRLNNQEQVRIDNPSGKYVVVVNPTAIRQGKQAYAVVWWFERDDLRVVYPNGGEFFNVMGKVVVRWEHGHGPVDIELSVNGADYTRMESGVEGTSRELTLPWGVSGKARVRVVDSKGFDVSDAEFTILGIPVLSVNNGGCAVGGSVLSWTEASGATGYQLLRARMDEGEYEEFKEFDKDTREYTIADEDLLPGRNLFSVRAKGENGLIGGRAKGLLLEGAQKHRISKATLPIEENFVSYPSSLFRLKLGKKVSASYYPAPQEAKPILGQNMLVVRIDKDRISELKSDLGDQYPKFDLSDMMKVWENNPESIGTLTFCGLDLTDLPSGEKVFFQMDYQMSYFPMAMASQCRVKVQGETIGATYQSGGKFATLMANSTNDPIRSATYDLSAYAGQNVEIEVEFIGGDVPPMGVKRTNMIAITRLRFFQPDSEQAVAISGFVGVPKQKKLGSKEPITIGVRNRSASTLTNVPVFYQIDDQKGVFELIAELKPFEELDYTFEKRADFSVADELGKNFVVKAGISLPQAPGGEVQEFQTATTTYMNYGDVKPLQLSTFGSMFGLRIAMDPSEVVYVKDRLLVSDDGGAHANYNAEGQVSSMRFVPFDPNTVIQVSFNKANLSWGDSVMLFLNQYPQSFPYTSDRSDSWVAGAPKDVPVFLSQAPDGSIVLRLSSLGYYGSEEGFLAEVRAIPRENIFKLTVPPLGYHEDGQVPIVARVENLSDEARGQLSIGYSLDRGKTWVKEAITGEIAGGATHEHTFAKRVEVPASEYQEIWVQLFALDTDPRDNMLKMQYVNDSYCMPVGIVKPGKLAIRSMTLNESKRETEEKVIVVKNYYNEDVDQGMVAFNLEPAIDVYKEDEATLSIELSQEFTADFAAGVYVDWNQDKSFGADEFYAVAIADGEKEGSVKFTPPAGAKVGETRMRVIVGKKDEIAACEEELRELGDMEDYALNVKASSVQNLKDIAVKAILTQSGKGFGDQEPIRVLVKNLGKQASGRFTLSYTFDGAATPVEEEFDELPAGEEREISFTQTVDLSTIGEHNLVVSLVSADENPENNQQTASIYSIQPAKDGFFTLHLPEGKSLELGSLDFRPQEHLSLEGWFRITDAPKTMIFSGKGIKLYFEYDGSIEYNPNDTWAPKPLKIVFEYIAPDGSTRYMEAGLKPEEIPFGAWNHIYFICKADGFFGPSVHIGFNDASWPYMSGRPGQPYLSNDKVVFDQQIPFTVGGEGQLDVDELRVWDTYNLAGTTSLPGKTNPIPFRYEHAPQDMELLICEFSFDEGDANRAVYSKEGEREFVALLPDGAT